MSLKHEPWQVLGLVERVLQPAVDLIEAFS